MAIHGEWQTRKKMGCHQSVRNADEEDIARTYMVIGLLFAILGKESRRGRHCERSSTESDTLRFPVCESEVDEFPSYLLSDTGVRDVWKDCPVRILTNKIGGVFPSCFFDSRTERSVVGGSWWVSLCRRGAARRELLDGV
jgi:hypothetical protein